jgi:hypothetical protein
MLLVAEGLSSLQIDERLVIGLSIVVSYVSATCTLPTALQGGCIVANGRRALCQ